MEKKKVIFYGVKKLDMKPNDDITRMAALQIAFNRVDRDLDQYPDFHGRPHIVKEVIHKHESYYEIGLQINNKSGKYEDMYYNCYVDNSEIFTYIIEELEKSIQSASMGGINYE